MLLRGMDLNGTVVLTARRGNGVGTNRRISHELRQATHELRQAVRPFQPEDTLVSRMQCSMK
jgi:hypothetical protein